MKSQFIIFLLFSIIALGISQQQCLTQIPNCAQCALNSSSTCNSCSTNYTLNGDRDQCILCALDYCQNCSQPNVCTKCKSADYTQFKLVPDSDVVTCIKCNTNSCARCSENFFCAECSNDDASGKPRKPDQNGQNCNVCQVPNCKHCQSPDKCRVCQNLYTLNSQYQCTICKVNNCQSCSSDDFCQKCSQGWSEDSTGKCIKCQYPCKTCNADGSCDNCDFPLYNLKPSVMAANNKQCFKPSVGNCQSHSQSNNSRCLACRDFYDLVSGQNSCALKCYQNCLTCDSVNKSRCLSCRQFQYLTSTNTCQNCQPGKRSNASNPTACLLAQIGFFILNRQAKKCPSYCQSCQNQTVCTQFVETEGETLVLSVSDQSYQLAKCSGYCLTCSKKNPQICIQCYEGLYLQSGVCKLCTSECKTCNATAPEKCISCPFNQFLSSERCVACNSNCLTCQSATALTACTSCKNGFWLNKNTKVCVSGCPANCLSCSSATSCEKCNTGYTTLLEPTSRTYTCTPCGTNCRKCMEGNTDVCLDCGDGFSTLTGQTCVQLSAFCRKGLGSLCTQCLVGYQLFSGSTCGLECQFPCATCTTLGLCTSCIGGYIYDSLTKSCQPKTYCNRACNICPLGYSLSFGNCIKCTSANCQRCDTTTPSQCYSCLNGYYLNGSGVCQTCSTQCKSCISSSKCTSCVSGYYHTSTFQCLACSTAAQCLTCYDEPTKCSSCASGYDLVGWKCKKKCTFNSTSNSTCLGCDDKGVCIACPTGYTLISNSGTGGQPCIQCKVTNCLNCYNSANTCSQCQNGYYLDTVGKCERCLTANCNICYQASICFDCKIGFIITDNGTCSSCLIPNCQDCFSDTICKICNAGYTTDISTGQCFICNLTNCDQCISKDQCILCKTGFVLNYTLGTCQTCSINNCDECQTSDYCKICKTGYSLDAFNGGCIECNVTGCSQCIIANLCGDSCANGTTSVVSSSDPTKVVCVPCAIKDCTYCLWDNYCYTCDTSVDNFNSPDLNGQNCITCNVVNCAVCSTANVCALCLHPFGLNSANKCVNCVVDNCLQCSSFGICSKCLEGYTSSASGSCVQCPDDCQTCLPNRKCITCKQPKFNYYPSSNQQNQGICFKKTISNCRYQDRNNNSKCQQCNTYYKYNTTTDTCDLQCNFACKTCNQSAPNVCLTCKDSAFLNGTTCSPCPNGCKICTTADNCTQLESGYFINSNGRIRSCGKKCKKCSSQTKCNQLEDGQSQGKALFSAGGNSSQTQILICTSTCKKCQTTQKCLDCSDGFYLQLQSSRDRQGICYPCNPKCKLCDRKDRDICLSCFENSFLSNKTCAQCDTNCLTCKSARQPAVCTSCKDGFYLDKTTFKCAQGCPLNCIACASLTQCSLCITGYTTFLDTDNTSVTFNQIICTPCVLSCRLCTAGQPSNCIQCGDGFYKNGGDCIACPLNCKICTEAECTNCNEKFDLVVKDVQTNEKVCAPSCIRPCTQCVIGSPRLCTKCQAGFTFNGVSACNIATCGTAGCVICTSGFVLAKSTKVCQKCTVSNCQKCQQQNTTKCLTCGLSFYLNDSANTCVSCPSQCTECFSDTQCTQCADGYVLQTKKRNRRGFKCVKCQDKCLTCKGDDSKCASCSAGFTLNGWKCQKSFKAQMDYVFSATVKQFNKNSRSFLALMLRILGYTDPDQFSFESIKSGSVILVASVALPGDSGSPAAADAFSKLAAAASEKKVAGMDVQSSGVAVKGGSLTSTSDSSISSLSIILGVTIPLGILLIVGIVLFIVYKNKDKDGFKYSDGGTQRRTENESYSKAKIEYEDNSLI